MFRPQSVVDRTRLVMRRAGELMSRRHQRARQAHNARKSAQAQRRRAAREANAARIGAAEDRLVAHNRAHQRRSIVFPALPAAQDAQDGTPQECVCPHPAMAAVASESTPVRVAFAKLLAWCSRYAPHMFPSCEPGLLAIARQHDKWRRPLERAPRAGKKAETRLLALARHLFEKYPASDVLLRAFLAPNEVPVHWYIDVTNGMSVREVVGTQGVTKRAAHLLGRAPRDLDAIRAVWWAKVRALGGTRTLAYVVATQVWVARYRVEGKAAEFWNHVLAWLVSHPEFPHSRVEELARYLWARREREPSLSMKGRTVERLIAILDEEKREALAKSKRKLEVFSPCGLSGATFVTPGEREGFERTWSIREILDTETLELEGKAMRHCVASYSSYIRDGESAIFSMTREMWGETKRALTIEVEFDKNRKRGFGEVRGKANREPTPEESAIVRRWARKVGIAAHL